MIFLCVAIPGQLLRGDIHAPRHARSPSNAYLASVIGPVDIQPRRMSTGRSSSATFDGRQEETLHMNVGHP